MPGVPVVPLPNSISLSAMTVFVVFAVVVVPFTVKLPVITAFLVTAKSLPIVTSSGCEIVTVPELSATVISFDVPEIVNVPPNATALVLEPSEIVIELFVNDEFAIFDNVLSAPLIVLLVSVCVAANPAKLSDCKALLNSAKLPVNVLFAKSIDLFVSVSVVSLKTI